MTARQHPRSARAAYIRRVGMGRIGVSIGTIVFVWLVADWYRTTFESLRTVTGWLRLLGVAMLCVVEWVIGAGWVIGAALWQWRGQDVVRRDPKRKR